MLDIAEIMDAAKARNDIRSDRQLGRQVGVTETAPGFWRRGYALPSDASMVTLCNLAGFSPDMGLIWIRQQKAEGEARTVWDRIAAQIDRKTVSLDSEAA